MATSRQKPLLAPGNEAEWERINREEDAQRHASVEAMTPSQRISRGQQLSQQAVRLLAASMRAGNVPKRAFWS